MFCGQFSDQDRAEDQQKCWEKHYLDRSRQKLNNILCHCPVCCRWLSKISMQYTGNPVNVLYGQGLIQVVFNFKIFQSLLRRRSTQSHSGRISRHNPCNAENHNRQPENHYNWQQNPVYNKFFQIHSNI